MDAVNMQIDKRGIDILRNKDDEWLRIFRFSTDRRFRTHIHPLNAPGTELPITRFRPSDHPWQYGLFVGMNKVNGLDFWCSDDAHYPAEIRGIMRNCKICDVLSTPAKVTFTAVNHWLGPAKEHVLEEKQTVHVESQDFDKPYVFDVTLTLTAVSGSTAFGASEYGGLSLRMVGNSDTRKHLNSEGASVPQCSEKEAVWVSVAQPIDGFGLWARGSGVGYAYAGAAIFDHPENFRFPNLWRVDNAGMINPAPALKGDFDLEKNASLTLRYRIFVFAGEGDCSEIQDAYNLWVKGK